MKKITLLGASGSIGEQTIDIIRKNPTDFSLVAVSVGHKIEALKNILKEFSSIKSACVIEECEVEALKQEFPQVSFYAGDEGLIQLIDLEKTDMVVNALVGFSGFLPSVHTIEKGIDLALANKESLVVGGEIINRLLKKSSSHLYPIDSEHVALAKCLKGKKKEEVKRLLITASGGAFRDLTRDELNNVTVKDALNHPSWSMGKKITIDCATMMNKGFEIIEAKYLFGFDTNQIDVLLHDESVIHSLVEFKDNSYLADLGPADMRVPISYALYEGTRVRCDTKTLDLESLSALHFRKFSFSRYPMVKFALDAIKIGGDLPAVLNASNEEAVYAFLNDEISFLDIEEIVHTLVYGHKVKLNPTVEDLVKVDHDTRINTRKEIERRKK